MICLARTLMALFAMVSAASGHDVRLPEAFVPVWVGVHYDGEPQWPYGVQIRTLGGRAIGGGALEDSPDVRVGQLAVIHNVGHWRYRSCVARVVAVDRWVGGFAPPLLTPHRVREINWNTRWAAPCEPDYHYPLTMEDE